MESAARRADFCRTVLQSLPPALPGNGVYEKLVGGETHFASFKALENIDFLVKVLVEALRKAAADPEAPSFSAHAVAGHQATFQTAIDSMVTALEKRKIRSSKKIDSRDFAEWAMDDNGEQGYPRVRWVLETQAFNRESHRPKPLQWVIDWSKKNFTLLDKKVETQRRKELRRAIAAEIKEKGVGFGILACVFAGVPKGEIMRIFANLDLGGVRKPASGRIDKRVTNETVYEDERMIVKIEKLLMGERHPRYASMGEAYRRAVDILAERRFVGEEEKAELVRFVRVVDSVSSRVVFASLEESAYRILNEGFTDLGEAAQAWAIEDLENMIRVPLGDMVITRGFTAFLVHEGKLVRW